MADRRSHRYQCPDRGSHLCRKLPFLFPDLTFSPSVDMRKPLCSRPAFPGQQIIAPGWDLISSRPYTRDRGFPWIWRPHAMCQSFTLSMILSVLFPTDVPFRSSSLFVCRAMNSNELSDGINRTDERKVGKLTVRPAADKPHSG
jgi:hypothetical protein